MARISNKSLCVPYCSFIFRGVYYWRRASRKEQIKVKMVIAEDESSTDVVVQGDDGQIDELRKELKLMEKGMVYVKGILER